MSLRHQTAEFFEVFARHQYSILSRTAITYLSGLFILSFVVLWLTCSCTMRISQHIYLVHQERLVYKFVVCKTSEYDSNEKKTEKMKKR